ncbi:phosphoglycerate dehydrogenase [Rhodohalobacter sp. SW132]|uniref:2-hydroxyacid dehydrogenase n=1 Tax=Rhodohalobacter sp. SW132 TaxID=2293433 RepID=UPI000E240198|nr:hydroxyacid dehydrogenase [Rhodohalobacter sp. SW132]REL29168.1 phosphoglycerate dehydrogenase [Rhodohalobacter sp. SW132]
MKKNVLLLETIAAEADSKLRKQAAVFEAFNETDPLKITGNESVQAIITRGKGRVDRVLIEKYPDLKVVARCGVGLDNIDVDEATTRNIKVVNAPGSNSDTMAEHTLALMLMLVRNTWKTVSEVKQNNWEFRNQYSGDEIHGKTLGILGTGNIGSRVARLAKAFGMNVIFWNEFPAQTRSDSYSLEEVLKRSDIISIHLPLLEETRNLLGEKELGMMKPGSFLINTARGAVIDQDALLKALNQGKIAGFAADVLAVEPPGKNCPLLTHPKTVITPHTGSLTDTTYRNMCLQTVENVLAILSGKEPDSSVVFNRDDLTG